MSGTTSIVRAEERALAGNNESQDSEQVLEAYQRMYGIGLVSAVGTLWRPAWLPPGARSRSPVDMLTAFGATDEQLSASRR